MPANPFVLDTQPAKGLIAITPADGAGLQWSTPIRGIYVGGAGNIAITALDGSTATLIAAAVGTVLQVGALRIAATGTTATNLVGLI